MAGEKYTKARADETRSRYINDCEKMWKYCLLKLETVITICDNVGIMHTQFAYI